MNARSFRLVLAAAALIAIGAWTTFAATQTAPVSKGHPVLAGRTGDYETSIVFSSGGKPTGPAAKGSAKLSSILGDRFVHIDESGEMMGSKFTALKLFGFNSESGRHEGTWLYTGSTALMRLSGTTSEGESVTFDATYDGANGESRKFKITVKPVDAKQFMIKLASDEMTEEVTYTKR